MGLAFVLQTYESEQRYFTRAKKCNGLRSRDNGIQPCTDQVPPIFDMWTN